MICVLFHFSYDLSNRKNKCRRYGQLIQSHLYKSLSKCSVRTKLTTDSGPDTFFVCIIHNHLDHTENCLMMGIINVVKLWILPVDRQCILCQIIRSDREEIQGR